MSPHVLDYILLAVPCPSGTEYNYVTSKCAPCSLGYYREEGRDPACLKCPPGHTTVSTRSADCVASPGESGSLLVFFQFRWHHSDRKGQCALHPVCQQSPVRCPRNRANVRLVEHRSFPTSGGGVSATFFSSFRLSMLWCSGLSTFRKLLKPRSVSALPGCRPNMMPALLDRLDGWPTLSVKQTGLHAFHCSLHEFANVSSPCDPHALSIYWYRNGDYYTHSCDGMFGLLSWDLQCVCLKVRIFVCNPSVI